VWHGLSQPQKELPAKFFYDERGSELFTAITELPEYYPTRCERAILESWMPELIATFEPGTLAELGAGSGEKTRIILRAMHALSDGRTYVPIDVSEQYLHAAAVDMRREFPRLTVTPLVADITAAWSLPEGLPAPMLLIFLGGTIGNFQPPEAVALLRQVRQALHPDDRFLMGVDLRKDPRVLELAYNDSQGVTAEFNRNMLRALNTRYRTTFDLEAFQHRAFYDEEAHRIEMHLVAQGATAVTVPGYGSIAIAEGETIRTEISCKHDRDSVAALFGRAGLTLVEMRTDPSGRFALVEGAPSGAPA
jgi:L-histidine N-alpha-methyltransferase